MFANIIVALLKDFFLRRSPRYVKFIFLPELAVTAFIGLVALFGAPFLTLLCIVYGAVTYRQYRDYLKEAERYALANPQTEAITVSSDHAEQYFLSGLQCEACGEYYPSLHWFADGKPTAGHELICVHCADASLEQG